MIWHPTKIREVPIFLIVFFTGIDEGLEQFQLFRRIKHHFWMPLDPNDERGAACNFNAFYGLIFCKGRDGDVLAWFADPFGDENYWYGSYPRKLYGEGNLKKKVFHGRDNFWEPYLPYSGVSNELLDLDLDRQFLPLRRS